MVITKPGGVNTSILDEIARLKRLASNGPASDATGTAAIIDVEGCDHDTDAAIEFVLLNPAVIHPVSAGAETAKKDSMATKANALDFFMMSHIFVFPIPLF